MSGQTKITKAVSLVGLIAKLRLMKQPEPVQLVDFVFSSYLIKPQQVRSELIRLAQIVVTQKPKVILEIGTLRGGTLCVFSRLASSDAAIVSVDLPNGPFGGGYKWFYVPIFKSFPVLRQKLHLIRGDSHTTEVRAAVERIAGSCPIELLFIDGDHSYESVRQDFVSYEPLVRRNGGIVAFHDIAEHPPAMGCEVSRFWNEIKKDYRHEEIVEDWLQGWGGIGILYL